MDLGRPWVLRALVIALAVVVGAIVWIATSDGDEGPPPAGSTPPPAEARIVSEDELAEIASSAEYPVYWAGPIPDSKLEVTEEPGGGVLIRYLRDGAAVGEGRADFLAVGSYPVPNPRKALDNFAGQPGAIVRRAPQLGRIVSNRRGESNVYFVDPGNEVQVEVYAPSPKRALSLVRSGQVQPVE